MMRINFVKRLRSLTSAALLAGLSFAGADAAAAQGADNLHLAEKRDLAGLLGQAHYVRTLCNGKRDQYWRNFMRDFLELEAVNESRRSLFVKAFNYGYRYQSDHSSRSCSADTPALEAEIARQGRRLSETIAMGYLR